MYYIFIVLTLSPFKIIISPMYDCIETDLQNYSLSHCKNSFLYLNYSVQEEGILYIFTATISSKTKKKNPLYIFLNMLYPISLYLSFLLIVTKITLVPLDTYADVNALTKHTFRDAYGWGRVILYLIGISANFIRQCLEKQKLKCFHTLLLSNKINRCRYTFVASWCL